MNLKTAFHRLASKVVDILGSNASEVASDDQSDAQQRKVLDITKSKDPKLSDGLGNVVRVPTLGGIGVSQAPASELPVNGGSDASEQSQAALQGPRMNAANDASFDAVY